MSDETCEVCGRPKFPPRSGRGPQQGECFETGDVECGIAARLARTERDLEAARAALAETRRERDEAMRDRVELTDIVSEVQARLHIAQEVMTRARDQAITEFGGKDNLRRCEICKHVQTGDGPFEHRTTFDAEMLAWKPKLEPACVVLDRALAEPPGETTGPICGHGRFLVLIKRETEPFDVTAFDTEAEARAFESYAGAQWSDSYVAKVIKGPRDVVGDIAAPASRDDAKELCLLHGDEGCGPACRVRPQSEETTGPSDGRTSRECPNNPGHQCLDYDEAGEERSGRCVFACAIDNDRFAEQASRDSTPPVETCPRCSGPIRQEAMDTGCRVITVAGERVVRCGKYLVNVPLPTPPSTRGTCETCGGARKFKRLDADSTDCAPQSEEGK